MGAFAPGAGIASLGFHGLLGEIGHIDFVPINVGLAVAASAGGGSWKKV
jgi:hypothetical protein